MSQHDFVLDNQSGSSFRGDINTALQALVSQSMGTAAPSVTYAGQIWADTTNNLLKQRDTTNTSWITLGALNTANLGLLPATTPQDLRLFSKADYSTVAFTKTAYNTLQVKAGTQCAVNGKLITFSVATSVVMPTLTSGTDYAIYVCDDGTIRADSSTTNPSGYTTTNSRKVGGFHYGLIAGGTTVSIANGFCTTSAATRNGTTSTATALITGLASTSDLMAGMVITGTGITTGSVIVTVDSASQVTMNQNGGASATNSLTFTNTGMVWVQSDVDKLAGINQYSLWDLKWRPPSDPRGMVLTDGGTWFDIYMCSTAPDTNGTSKYNTDIASGTVLPKIPAVFGGNGTTTYASLSWWVANEIARSAGKRLPMGGEFFTAAFGVAENVSLDATSSTYPTATRIAGKTSKYGLEQAAGIHWVWCQDSNFYGEAASPAGSWKNVNGNSGANGSQRGQEYTFGTYGLARLTAGGYRTSGVVSGSRAAHWLNYPWFSSWSLGLRAACDHMNLD